MSEIATIKELSVEFATKQPHQVDYLLEETAVLDTIKFEKASHVLWNVAEEVTDVSGGGFVDMDAPLGYADVNSELRKVDLNIMGTKMFCPEDKGKAMGGRDKYFAKKQPKVLRKMGVDAEMSIIYDNLLPYAQDCGNLVNAGGSSNTNFILQAVRWVPGETIGLYGPEGFKDGSLFDTKPLHNGGLYEHPDTGVLGWGVRMKGYFGIQLLNHITVASLVNIDITSDTKKLPTEAMVDDFLAMIHANPKNTYIYGHYRATGVLGQISKAAKTTYRPDDQGVNTLIESWNGVPVVSCYNFLNGTEANVAVS